ncbi:MAG TPA: hypothetical protein VFH55_00850, partial [Nitrospiria bacterium]|nr:hypothetical protein [Nitrospiria bacterium]
MKRYVLLSILIGGLASPVLAWKTDTHQLISISATKLSGNYQRFLSEFAITRTDADNLLFYGSVAEDDNGRFVYHFYDPINEMGLDGIFDPAPVWGYRHTIPFFNEFSWVEARSALYEGLTSTTLEMRKNSYAKVFRSLGQIIHLVEDVAHPSHTRNDPHASHYENEAAAKLLNPSHLEDWAHYHSSNVIGFTNNATGPISVVSFDDPFKTLALFSNENFFSDDTIFKNYASPSYGQTNYEDSFIKFGILGEPVAVVAEDGHIYYVPYIFKTQGVLGGYKLAQVGYFGNQLADNPGVRELAF